MAENPNTAGANHSLGRRRDERLAEQITDATAARFTELTAANLEVWQKHLTAMATAAHYFGDTFNALSRAMLQMMNSDQSGRRTG